MPVKNGMEFLERSLEGIFACSQPSDEILVIDDRSTDGTLELLRQIAVTKSNLRILENLGTGLVDALNFGIESARHQWIARFDVDDVYEVNRLNSQLLARDADTVAVFSDYEAQTASGIYLGTFYSAVLPILTEFSVVSSQRLAHPSVLYSKKAVISAGMYKKEEFPTEDLGLWFRLMKHGSFATSPYPLLKYRIHNKSVSATKRFEMIRNVDSLITQNHSLLAEYGRKISLNPFKVGKIYRGMPHARERRLLLYRDFLISRKFKIVSNRKFLLACLGVILELTRPSSWKVIWFWYQEKKAREVNR